MRITFHGAAHTVTGSCHLIEVDGIRILLDCGLYQGPRAESRERNTRFPFDPTSIDVLVLSHAHIDHSGNIPNLVKRGFQGDIICTHATRDLCEAMLQDSGHIQEKDAEFINKRRREHNEPPILPLYTQADALASLRNFHSLGYLEPHALAPGITIILHDAGHMLGSAMVDLQIEDHSSKRTVRLIFSGDIGHSGMPILRQPTLFREADILIMESTYGGRAHPSAEETERLFEQIITETYERHGKIIIPAFAVGRTQQLVYTLNKLYNEHDLPLHIPVYVDSPLAVDITEVFRQHPEAYSDETRDVLDRDPDGDLFGFPRLEYIRDVEESKALNDRHEPMIIISASGMAEFGRILHHLKNNIGDSRNTIVIVGWQAPDTLGRRLVEGATKVRIFGEEYRRRAEVAVLNGFSGHADHDGLVSWVRAFDMRRPREVFLVHGEPQAAEALAASFRSDLGYPSVRIPLLHESFEV